MDQSWAFSLLRCVHTRLFPSLLSQEMTSDDGSCCLLVRCSGSQLEHILFTTSDMWHCLEVSLVVTTGGSVCVCVVQASYGVLGNTLQCTGQPQMSGVLRLGNLVWHSAKMPFQWRIFVVHTCCPSLGQNGKRSQLFCYSSCMGKYRRDNEKAKI